MTMPYANQTIMPSRPIREPKTSHAMSAGKEKMRQQAHMGSDVAKAIVSEPVQKIVNDDDPQAQRDATQRYSQVVDSG